MSELIRPKALKEGSTIGIAAPCASFLKSNFEKGVDVLRGLGFEVKFSENIFRKKGYLAGTDEERSAELNFLFADNSVDAIMFARGGYGIQRIIPGLDFNSLRTNPKLVIGYSDLTALTSYITSRLSMSSVHGPVVTGLSDKNDETSKSLKNLVTSNRPLGEIKNDSWMVIKEGEARGRFVGGCLTLLASSVGTKSELQTEESILFIEDLSERIYRYDRMLTQLKNAGALKTVRGIVFGSLELEPSETHPEGLWPMVEYILRDFDGPVVAGLRSGHVTPFYSVPLGVGCSLVAEKDVRLQTSDVRLVFEEAALV